jgi:hypothetical protein
MRIVILEFPDVAAFEGFSMREWRSHFVQSREKFA